MDWGRAKNVLILAFLLLNIVLGYQLWLEWQERIDSSVDWTSLPPETRQIMTNKGIRVDAEIPTETPEMREITYRLLENPDGGSGSPIPLESQPNTRVVFAPEELQQALGGAIPELSEYRFDNLGSNEKMFVLNRMVDGWPIFDVKIELFYKDQKITAYHQDRIEILPYGEAKLQKVLPATKAVANLIDRNYLPAGSVIKEIQLGYHGQIFDSETQVSAPSWRVLLEDGEVFYVHAISGEAVTDQGDASSGAQKPGKATANAGHT
ncbi:two-component system regulatory protein YycI [Cohnella thermotolerans]|uniref:two-component system regulatory protein YycI n=1 Tax=Cohnella thermotolerans TaxID=329858 RepID=UPI000424C127|nr:two-component system regulatory protein YycI [Cohnella thermotolerans]